MPERIQLRRTKGWRLPSGVVNVARPTKWGNPFSIDTVRAIEQELSIEPTPIAQIRADLVAAFRSVVKFGPDSGYWSPDNYKAVLVICDGLNAGELRGKDLACWCPLDQPCHADVLLEIANGGGSDAD
jgi:hypothetical protein